MSLTLNNKMYSLIDLVILIYSFFPSTLIIRLFVMEKGGRPRDPRTGRYVSSWYVKVVSLVAAMFSYFVAEPVMSNWISNFCAYNSSNVYFLLFIGIALYFFALK